MVDSSVKDICKCCEGGEKMESQERNIIRVKNLVKFGQFERKSYSKPLITVYGTLNEITRAKGSGANLDALRRNS